MAEPAEENIWVDCLGSFNTGAGDDEVPAPWYLRSIAIPKSVCGGEGGGARRSEGPYG
jgi:hypothetical protein